MPIFQLVEWVSTGNKIFIKRIDDTSVREIIVIDQNITIIKIEIPVHVFLRPIIPTRTVSMKI